MAVGYPMSQSCLLVSGLWGIVYFGEVKGARSIFSFFLFALVLPGRALPAGSLVVVPLDVLEVLHGRALPADSPLVMLPASLVVVPLDLRPSMLMVPSCSAPH